MKKRTSGSGWSLCDIRIPPFLMALTGISKGESEFQFKYSHWGSESLLHHAVPARNTEEGLRAVSGNKPIHPESVETYLESKFGDALNEVTEAMTELAKSLPPSELAEKAYTLYEKFRPEIPPGKKG